LINFSNTKKINSKNEKLIFIIALIFTTTCFFIISYIQIKQIKLLLNLKNDFHELNQYITQQKYLFDQKIKLNKKLKELEKINEILFPKLFDIKHILNIILKNIPADCCLDDLSYDAHKISIKGKAKSWLSLNNFSNILNTKIGKIIKNKKFKKNNLIIYEIILSL